MFLMAQGSTTSTEGEGLDQHTGCQKHGVDADRWEYHVPQQSLQSCMQAAIWS